MEIAVISSSLKKISAAVYSIFEIAMTYSQPGCFREAFQNQKA